MSVEVSDHPPRALAVGQPIEGEINSENTPQAFEIEVPAGHYLRVAAEQHGGDVELRLFDPAGCCLAGVDSPTGAQGDEAIGAVAASGGNYRVELHLAGAAGPYRLRVVELREATVADRRRSEAEQDFAVAENLRRQMKKIEVEKRPQARTDALALYRNAYELFGGLGDGRAQGHVRYGQGVVAGTAESIEAAEYFAEGAALFAAAGDTHWRLVCLNNQARELLLADEDEAAFEIAVRARDLALEADHQLAAADAFTHLGDVHSRLGQSRLALDAFTQARERWNEEQHGDHLRLNWLRVGRVLLSLGETGDAIDALERSLRLATGRSSDEDRARILTELGNAHYRARELERARERLKESQAARPRATTLSSLGTVQLALGDTDAAGESFAEALAIYEESDNDLGVATLLNKQGHLFHARGDFEASHGHHHRAAAIFERQGYRRGVVSARYGVARALAAQGHLQRSKDEIEAFLDEAEELFAVTDQLELRTSYLASKHHYVELHVDVLMRLHETAPESRYDLVALDQVERWRARTLRDLLRQSELDRSDLPPQLAERLRRAERELNAADLAQLEALDDDDPEPIAAAEQRLQEALNRLRLVRSEVRDLGFATAAAEETRGVVTRLKRQLEADTLVAVYSLGERQDYLWTITSEGVVAQAMAKLARRDERLAQAHELLSSRSPADAATREPLLGRISQWALAPIEQALAGSGRDLDDFTRLVVVTDGALGYLPFAALPHPSHADRSLIDDLELAHQGSLAALLTLRGQRTRRAERTVAVLADPVFNRRDGRVTGEAEAAEPEALLRTLRDFDRSGLERLPGTRREAAAILAALPEGQGDRGKAFFDFNASRETIFSGRLADYRILHFATHGFLNHRHPELSGLALSGFDGEGTPRDGFLRLHEIYDLDLGAELVVLSGCETGLGREYRGEGLFGLPQAFMTAGVPRVVVSLWPVADDATAELMAEFYLAMLQRGATPAAALRSAQLSRRKAGAPPVDWAGFVLLGDWRLADRFGDDDSLEEAATGGGNQPPPEPPPDEDLPGPTEPPTKPAARATGDGDDDGGGDDGGDRLYFNGLRADGSYVQPPLEPAEVGRLLLGRGAGWSPPPEEDERGHDDPTRRPRPDVDVQHLDQAGWAVVFAAGVDPEVRRALDPLLDLRKSQAGQHYKELMLEPGETLDGFLRRLRAPLGVADPFHLPYYVLLVGGPDDIPFSFQHQLDMVYAVGRLDLETADDYTAYANTVVDTEAGRLPRRRRAVSFWGAENGGDRATQRTHRDLVAPLADHVAGRLGWPVERHLGSDAGRDRLLDLLSGDAAPAMLFTGSHGLRIDGDEDRQRSRQGALVTSDWPGEGYVEEGHCVAADDLDGRARVDGLVLFQFACYSGGTPVEDAFEQRAQAPRRLARRPFVSALSRRLLGRHGGALAVVGHVDRAWTTSFDWYRDTGQRAVFESVFDCLLRGEPVGAAMEYFGQLTGDLALRLADRWERSHRRQAIDEAHFARLWIAHNDARNFAVFGDPAVRLSA